MEQPKSQFRIEAERIQLTPAEKAAMWGNIRAHMGSTAVRLRAQTRSPYAFSYFHISRVAMSALAALLVVVLAGGGTVYASQGALPGDLLYPVKVGVADPVEVALATTPAAKAQVHVALAQERLHEAQALAAQGKLTATTSAEIAANFDEHTQAAAALTQDVAQHDPGVAVQISTELDAGVAANGAVLASIEGEAKDDITRQNVSALAAHVLREDRAAAASTTLAALPQHLTVFAASSTASSSTTTGPRATAILRGEATSTYPENKDSSAAQQQIAAALEARATQELQKAQQLWAGMQGSVDATTTTAVQAQLDALNVLMSNGSAALGAQSYDAAIANFQQAFSRTIMLETFLRAGQETPTLLSPLLRQENNPQDSGDNNDNKGGESGAELHGGVRLWHR